VGTKFDLMVAPTGARLMKSDHPALPISSHEIAETALSCSQAGATAIHVHVRDAAGRHSLDPDRYAETVRHIATRTPIRIQISTEAAGQFDVATQRKCLAHAPARDASVSLREIAREPQLFADTYRMANDKGIDVQHILYNADDLTNLLRLYDEGEIPEQSRRAIFVLGRYSTDQISLPADLDPFIRSLGPQPLNWSTCAFGPNEQTCLLAALNNGGDVRIGFENNFTAPDGTIFPDNATSVASFVEAADKAGFQPKQVTS